MYKLVSDCFRCFILVGKPMCFYRSNGDMDVYVIRMMQRDICNIYYILELIGPTAKTIYLTTVKLYK